LRSGGSEALSSGTTVDTRAETPETGEIVDVPPKKLPFFKVGKELKEMVNTGGV